MRITPLDVRKQEFRKVVRGLDADEVYAFLTTVADEYEACLSDNKQLREKVIDLDEKVSEYRNMETTLRDTLLTAERVMSEARQNARKEAELILRDATMKANGQTAHIAAEVEALKNQLRELRGHRDGFLARLQSLAESQVTLVESFRRDFESEDAERSVQRAQRFGDTEPATPAPAPTAETTPTPDPVESVVSALESELPREEAPSEPTVASTPTDETPAPAPIPTPVDSAVAAPDASDQWRDYSVGDSGSQTENRAAEAPVAVLAPQTTETATESSFEVPTFAYESEAETAADQVAIEIAIEESFAEPPAEPVAEVAVAEATPAAPVETEIDHLDLDPSEEDPVDRIARMMAEAAAGPESVALGEPEVATGGQEEVAVATSPAPTEDEGTMNGDSSEESRWSLSKFTKGLANF